MSRNHEPIKHIPLAALALVVVTGVSIFAFAAGKSDAVQPGPARIDVTVHELKSKATNVDHRITRVFEVLNRPAYRNPIGHGILICNQADLHLYGCRAYLQFQRGQIMLGGLVSDFDFFRLGVLGGTGYYDNTGGSAIIQRIGKDAWAVVINLQGF